MLFRRTDPLRFFQRIGGKTLADEIIACDKVIKRYDRRYRVKGRSSAVWHSPGAVVRIHPYERGVRLDCERGWVELHWISPDCLRVRLRTQDGDFIPPFSYAVDKVDWPVPAFTTSEREDSLEMRTSSLVCRVGKHPFRLLLETVGGRRVSLDTKGLQWQIGGGVRLSLALHPDESSHGLGERAAGLNLRGKRFKLWNAEPPKQYTRDTDPLYYSIPFYLGVRDDLAYGVFWDNSSRGMVDIGVSSANELAFEAESGELRYYLFTGSDVNSVVGRYTELTGRIKLPPLWALGYHQSRFSYASQTTVLELAAEFRNRSMPCDAIHLDIPYMDDFRIFTWSGERFPDAAQMIAELHNQGFKIVTILNPGVKVDPDYDVYKSGIANDVFLKYPDGHPVAGAVWAGASRFPDFTSPAARAWWVDQFGTLTSAGVDGIWNDMSEPTIFGANGIATTLPDYVRHDKDGLGGDHLEIHNSYGTLMARATTEALEKHRATKRQVSVARSGYAGTQRYSMSWTGHNQADWDQLRLSISMALNMGMSGAPLTGSHIGGISRDASAELFTRWLQAACLMPFFRNHAALESAPQEPWAYGQPYEVINRLTIQLRYRLLPYLYSIVAQAREYGWPVVRPLFTAEPTNAALRSLDDSFLLGDALLVAPVLDAGAIRREVYLPVGFWYDFWTNEFLEGGRHINVLAPLERLPLFVKAGAVLPMWPDMQYVGEKPIETLLLRAYPGDLESVLYEDAGEGLEYADGDYRWVYTTCEWEDNQFILKRRTAGRYQPEYKSIRVEIAGLREEPLDVRLDWRGAPLWFYDNGVLEVTTDDTFGKIEVINKVDPDDRTLMHRPR
jgi:alpha-glucosidase